MRKKKQKNGKDEPNKNWDDWGGSRLDCNYWQIWTITDKFLKI